MPQAACELSECVILTVPSPLASIPSALLGDPSSTRPARVTSSPGLQLRARGAFRRGRACVSDNSLHGKAAPHPCPLWGGGCFLPCQCPAGPRGILASATWGD